MLSQFGKWQPHQLCSGFGGVTAGLQQSDLPSQSSKQNSSLTMQVLPKRSGGKVMKKQQQNNE